MYVCVISYIIVILPCNSHGNVGMKQELVIVINIYLIKSCLIGILDGTAFAFRELEDLIKK